MYSQSACRFPLTGAGPSERAGFIDAPEIGPPNIASRPTVPPIAIAAASPKVPTASARSGRVKLFEFGLDLVAAAEPRLDERVRRRRLVDLLAEAANEDVDGAVTMRL